MTPGSTAHRAETLTEAERRFAVRAARRKSLFVGLSFAGVVVALGLAGAAVYRWREPSFSAGAHVALVLMILLNARANLRQARYAAVLRKLVDAEDPPSPSRE